MRVTDPHPRHHVSKEELERVLKERGIESDLDIAQGVADAVTWTGAGLDPHNSLKYLSDFPPEEIGQARLMQQEISELRISKLPGNTPAEKAASYAQLRESADRNYEKSDWVSNLIKAQIQKKRLQATNKMLDGLEQLQKGGNKFGESILNPEGRPITEILGQLTEEQKQLLLGLGTIQEIGFKAKALKTTKPDPMGSELDYKEMEELSEFTDLSPLDWGRPDFVYKLINKDFQIPFRTSRSTGDKKVYVIVIDRSGSMAAQYKMGMIKGVLVTIFEEVRKGEAVVYVSTFEQEIDGWAFIETEEQARAYYDAYQEPEGGETAVGKVIQEVQTGIRERDLGGHVISLACEPELIIVNDGQDDVDPLTRTMAPVTAISIERNNKDLRTLCQRSGGQFYLV